MRLPAALLAFAFATHAIAADGDTAIAVSGTSAVPATKPAAVDKIWSAVVLATNPPSPKDAPLELREFTTRLKRVFGYSQFELIGAAAEKIDEQNESWLVPSQSFWLSVKARRAVSTEARGGYLLNLQLFHDKRPTSKPKPTSPPAAPSSSAAPSTATASSSSSSRCSGKTARPPRSDLQISATRFHSGQTGQFT